MGNNNSSIIRQGILSFYVALPKRIRIVTSIIVKLNVYFT